MQADSPLVTVPQILMTIRAHWRSVALMLTIAVALGIGITEIMPKRFVAEASVLLDVKSPDPINGLIMQGMMAPSYMNTQVDLIRSEPVARRVVRDLRLAESQEAIDAWRKSTNEEVDIDSWLVEYLGRGLKVEPTRDSSLLAIGFSATNPQFAASVANAYVKAYVDTMLDLRVAPAKEYKQFFDTSAKQQRDTLEAAQKRLSVFQQKNGLIGSEEALDIETSRLNALSAQLVMMQAQAADSNSRRAQARSNAESPQAVLESGLVSNLRADLQRNRSRLSELTESMGDNHPQVLQLKANIAELAARVKEETNRVVGGVEASSLVDKQRLSELDASIEQQRNKVIRMKATRDEAMVLRRDVESAQRSYDDVLGRANQMGLESQVGQTNVSVVGKASVPSKASSPSVVKNLAAASFLGLFSGLLLAFIREYRNPRVRTDEQAIYLLGQPLVAVIPRFSRGKSLVDSSRNAIEHSFNRLLGG